MTRNGGRISSWSTFGQTALLIIAALLVAQTLTVFLVRGILAEWQRSYIEQPALARFADVAGQIAAVPQDQRAKLAATLSQPGEDFWLGHEVKLPGFGRDSSLEKAMREALRQRGVEPKAVIALRGEDFGPFQINTDRHIMTFPGEGGRSVVPPPPEEGPRSEPFAVQAPPPANGPNILFGAGRGQGPRDVLRYGFLLQDGSWLVGRFFVARSVPFFLSPIFLSQAALFIVLLAATLFWASRISRPLRLLSRAAERLDPHTQFEPLAVHGPADVKAAISSFNVMALRVRELLQEKDRMLTALGHDLRTPLASLRIRAETVEPENERDKIIETVEEMTAMVEEILGLARLGMSAEPRLCVDLAALADTVVEDYASLGHAVAFTDSPRAPVMMQAGQVRRLMRHLIDNAVKFGKHAVVSVQTGEDWVEFCVEDEGPGIPAEKMGEMLQSFSRLEISRNRLTGGSGLGLTIADAIARSQGARLILQNRDSGGLRAAVRWDLTP